VANGDKTIQRNPQMRKLLSVTGGDKTSYLTGKHEENLI
jgi:hypothetical protein